MRKSELLEILKKEKVSPNSYSLNGGLPNEAYCLNKVNGTWEVYYSERGRKTGLKTFDSEDEACNYFFQLATE